MRGVAPQGASATWVLLRPNSTCSRGEQLLSASSRLLTSRPRICTLGRPGSLKARNARLLAGDAGVLEALRGPWLFFLPSRALFRAGEQQGEALGLVSGWKREVKLQEEPNLDPSTKPCLGEEEALMLHARARGTELSSSVTCDFPEDLGFCNSFFSKDVLSASPSAGLSPSFLFFPTLLSPDWRQVLPSCWTYGERSEEKMA